MLKIFLKWMFGFRGNSWIDPFAFLRTWPVIGYIFAFAPGLYKEMKCNICKRTYYSYRGQGKECPVCPKWSCYKEFYGHEAKHAPVGSSVS